MSQISSRQLIDRLESELQRRRDVHRYRSRQSVKAIDATTVEIDGRRLVNFAGNDYLGLSQHPLLSPRAVDTGRAASGAGASALVTGYSPAHAAAEKRIAAWKRTESAVLLPSGYQANHAAIQTLAAVGGETRESVRFLIDKLAHASLIDAVRATGQPFRIFGHNQLAKLERLLRAAPADQLQVVVTESIFSMDGDAADLAGLADLKQRYDFALLLDEAHGSGVYGPGGAGLAAERGLSQIVDVSVSTFSKAAGLAGGAVCGSIQFCEALVNFGRAYIYSTAIQPTLAMQIERAIELMAVEPLRQSRVRRSAVRVREALSAAGLTVPHGDSPIIPIVLGSETLALAAAETLRTAGILAIAIRPPTVAPNASRLRITISSEHSEAQLDHLIATVQELK